MRILVLLPQRLWPLNTGSAVTFFNRISYLARQGHDIDVVQVDDESLLPASLDAPLDTRRVRLHSVPRPRRTVALRQALGMPWQASSRVSSTLHATVGQILNTHRVDVVHVETPFLMPVLEHRPLPKVISLGTHNIEWRVLREMAQGASGGRGLMLMLEAERVRRSEAKWFGWSRLQVLSAVSGDDLDEAMSFAAPGVRGVVASVGMSHHAQPAMDGSRMLKRLLFLGSFSYQPNVDAAFWLLRDVWPRVRLWHPEWELRVVGRAIPAGLRSALISADGVSWETDIPDVVPEYAAAAFVLAPLRMGGGVKIKVLEALWFGVPVIATDAAVRGMRNLPTFGVSVASTDPEDFAAKISDCVSMPADERGRTVRELIEFSRATLSWDAEVAPLEVVWEELLTKPKLAK